MHSDNFEGTPRQAGVLDQETSALLTDLHAKGLLDQTVVVLGSEFGRTPRINDEDGWDYHNSVRCLLAGAGSRMWEDVRVGWRVHRLRRGHAQREFGRGSPS